MKPSGISQHRGDLISLPHDKRVITAGRNRCKLFPGFDDTESRVSHLIGYEHRSKVVFCDLLVAGLFGQ